MKLSNLVIRSQIHPKFHLLSPNVKYTCLNSVTFVRKNHCIKRSLLIKDDLQKKGLYTDNKIFFLQIKLICKKGLHSKIALLFFAKQVDLQIKKKFPSLILEKSYLSLTKTGQAVPYYQKRK